MIGTRERRAQKPVAPQALACGVGARHSSALSRLQAPPFSRFFGTAATNREWCAVEGATLMNGLSAINLFSGKNAVSEREG
jgi:hypothetical protein